MFSNNEMRIIKAIIVRCSKEGATSKQNITLIVYEYLSVVNKGLEYTMNVIEYVYNRLNFK